MFLAAFCCEDELLVHVPFAVYENLVFIPDGGLAFECTDFSPNLRSSAKWMRPRPLLPPGH